MNGTAAEAASLAGQRQAPPATMTIFGAAGDLTKRLVVPALYNLVRAGRLPDEFSFVGVDHNPFTTETWRQSLTGEMRDLVQKGRGRVRGATDRSAGLGLAHQPHALSPGRLYRSRDLSAELKALLAERNREREAGGNALFYLATADRFFCEIIQQLGRAGLTEQSEGAWRRVIVEKPFGHDLPSARALNEGILKVLSEDQIYRIDHFLGKEPVQNIMVLRFANGIFEPLWSRDHIDHVQITVAETLGVEERGRFYERTRRAKGYGAEPSVPAPRHDRDGAAHLLCSRCGAREENGAFRSDPSHCAGRCGARPIWTRNGAWPRRSGLPGASQT